MKPEQIQLAAELYANSQSLLPGERSVVIAAYKEGTNMLLDTEEWKDLYSEGVTAGIEMMKMYKEKADKWDKLDEAVGKYYSDEDNDPEESDGLISIGETAATHLGYIGQ